MAADRSTVLLVSDDPERTRVARATLERAGIAVVAALAAPPWSEPPALPRPSVVVLDLAGATEADAQQRLEAVRQTEVPQQAPILCWLGTDGRGQAGALLAAGAADFVVEPDELDARVEVLAAWRRAAVPPAEPQAHLRLYLFDPLRVMLGERVVMDAQYPRRKAQALLVYLYLKRGRYVSKYEILADLWPEAEQADPGRVKHTVQVLRSTLEDPAAAPARGWRYILERAGAYAFNAQTDRYVDSEEFEVELKLGRAACQQEQLDDALLHYRRAIDVRQGPFLAEFRYDDWAAAESARLQELYLQALEECARLESARASYALAIDLLRRAVAEDPLHESSYAELMRNLWLQGRRTDAVRVYQRLRDVLERKLGVEPQAQTTRLYEQIRRDEAIAV